MRNWSKKSLSSSSQFWLNRSELLYDGKAEKDMLRDTRWYKAVVVRLDGIAHAGTEMRDGMWIRMQNKNSPRRDIYAALGYTVG